MNELFHDRLRDGEAARVVPDRMPRECREQTDGDSTATLDGEPVTTSHLRSLADTNYGHYTSIRLRGRSARGFSHHLQRLAHDCHRLFGVRLDLARVRAHVAHAVRDVDRDHRVRITVFDPGLEIGRPAESCTPHVLVDVRTAPSPSASPLSVQGRAYTRDLPTVKHTGIFGALLERRCARRAGHDDALFVGRDGRVAEGPTWNVGFYDGTDIVWPDADALPGVTMTLLREVHEDTIVRVVTLSDLPDFAAAFATNVMVGIRPIARIDDVRYPVDHPILETLRSRFEAIPHEPIDG